MAKKIAKNASKTKLAAAKVTPKKKSAETKSISAGKKKVVAALVSNEVERKKSKTQQKKKVIPKSVVPTKKATKKKTSRTTVEITSRRETTRNPPLIGMASSSPFGVAATSSEKKTFLGEIIAKTGILSSIRTDKSGDRIDFTSDDTASGVDYAYLRRGQRVKYDFPPPLNVRPAKAL